MLYSYFTEKLLGIKGAIIKNIESVDESITIELEFPVQEHHCPCCGKDTRKVHDYRKQLIRDSAAFGKAVFLKLRKRRYRCPDCGKCFYEDTKEVLGRYQRITHRLIGAVINDLRGEYSFTSVAKRTGLSCSTVIRIFDTIEYPKPQLPRVLGIDEFKGNTWGEKYQCILTDLENNVVLDILPQRYSHYLSHYFKDTDRSNTKIFVSDMWRTYADFASVYFKDAVQIVDKYHFIRQAIWAFEAVRKEEQKRFSKSHRIYFKKSKTLLLRRLDHLTEEQKQQVHVMLYASPTLSSAHFLKEMFLKCLDASNRSEAKQLMAEWILTARDSGIPSFVACAKTFENWFGSILNSFDFPFTNGFTEGCNNKIKVLKRNAYGYSNFRRFRNRILHMFSHQQLNNKRTAA